MEDEHELTPHRSKSLRAQLVALALDALLVAACASTIQATGGDNLVPMLEIHLIGEDVGA